MAPKDILTLKILDSKSRKIIWMLLGLITTIVSTVFLFGKQYQETANKINQIPEIVKTVRDHDTAIKGLVYMRKDIKETRDDVKMLIALHLQQNSGR